MEQVKQKMNAVTSHQLIDASGLICPEPLMLLHGAVRDAKVGEVVKLISTDAATSRDVRQFCEFLGHELLAQEEGEDGSDAILHVIKKVG